MELAESERARGEREMGLGGKGARRDKSAKMQRNSLQNWLEQKLVATNEGRKTLNQNICADPK